MADPCPASSPAPSLVLADFIPYRLSVTSNLVSDSIARTYEALFGLTIPEWRLIAVIAETGGITQQAIGRATRMDKVTVSRAAIALVLFPRWLFLGRNVRHARTITWVVSQKHRCLREFRSPLRSPLSLLAPP